MSVPTLAISEIFGPTLQGEGDSIGASAAFVRTAGCHVRCSWCDTRYSWDSEDLNFAPESVTVDQALARMSAVLPTGGRRLVVVTGGEPLEQAQALAVLIARARAELAVDAVEVETSGTLYPGPLTGLVDRFTVSPKLANSAVAPRVRLREPVLLHFAAMDSAVFKFVVDSLEDLDEVGVVAQRLKLSSVTVMPQGTDAGLLTESMRAMAPEVARRGWRLSPRLHIQLWANQRGR